MRVPPRPRAPRLPPTRARRKCFPCCARTLLYSTIRAAPCRCRPEGLDGEATTLAAEAEEAEGGAAVAAEAPAAAAVEVDAAAGSVEDAAAEARLQT